MKTIITILSILSLQFIFIKKGGYVFIKKSKVKELRQSIYELHDDNTRYAKEIEQLKSKLQYRDSKTGRFILKKKVL